MDAFASSSERRALTTSERAKLRKTAKPGTEVQMERRLGVPTVLWAAEPDVQGGTPEQAARRHLGRLAPRFRLSGADLNSARVVSVHDTGRGGVIVKLRQSVEGVPVFREEANVLMTRDLGLVGITGYLSSPDGSSPDFSLSARRAVARAASDLLGSDLQASDLDPRGSRGAYLRFSAAALGEPARAKRVMYRLPGGLEPAYYAEVHSERADEHFGYVVAAGDGRILFRQNLVSHAEPFSYRVWADSSTAHLPLDGPQGSAGSPHPTGAPNGFAPPFEAPSLVSWVSGPISSGDPWLADSALETVGNNADAYADLVSPDGFSAGDTRATVTGTRQFHSTYDTGADPQASASQTQAAITQAFYDVNFLHDWFYDSGFDEAAGNAQADNYGRGGLAGDRMMVETQDFGGRNNANMFTPADGGSPRMQLYLFDGRLESSLTVNSPADIPDDFPTGTATFGPPAFDLTGDLAPVDDGTAPVGDGCQAMTGLASKIAVIDRGACTFKTKVRNAQDGGAMGVLIVNDRAGNPPALVNDATITTPITVPALSLRQSDGATIKAALGTGPVNATMSRSKLPDGDAAIDNQLVAHEWGHYISRRLVGGGAGFGTTMAGGLGEGWADFHALLMTVRAEDAASSFAGVYPIAAYTNAGANAFYFGIRRVPYSTDFTKNALTFKHIADGEPLPSTVPTNGGGPNSGVHNTGEVWATMLWESYAALLGDTLGGSPRLTFAEAQSRMRDYLVAAYKMTPPSPTLTEARDALLMVAFARDEQDGVAFAEAFARRGAGTGAVAPDRNAADNSPVTESFVVGGSLEFVSATLEDDVRSCDENDGLIDNGERGRLRIAVQNDGARTLENTTATITSANPNVLIEDSTISVPETAPFETTEASAVVSLKDSTDVETLDFDIEVHDPGVEPGGPVTASHETYGGADVARNHSANDDVESPDSTWLPETETGQAHWTRHGSFGPLNSVWHGPDAGHPSDTTLASPPLEAGTGPVSFSFSHRFSFEPEFDGGVIEISTDDGATWMDADTVDDLGYQGALTSGTDNPLSGREAYKGASPGYPSFATQTVELGTAFAGETILVRFRVGADAGVGGAGWDIDDLSFTGLVNQPFHALVADAGCTESPGSGGSGPPNGDGPSAQPNVAPVVSGVSLGARRFRAARAGPAIAAAPVGTRVSYRLSEAASVTVRYERKVAGRRVGGRCRAPSRRNRARRRCTRWVLMGGSAPLSGKAGANSFRLSGRWRGRAQVPGTYRLRLSAKDAAGMTSAARTSASFRIVRR